MPFVFFCGLINAYSVGQIITAHLVKLDFPYYNVLILPLAYGVFDSLGPFLQQKAGFGWPSALGDGGYQVAYMFMMLGTAIGVYGSFVVSIAFNISLSVSGLLSTGKYLAQSPLIPILIFPQVDVIVTICDYLDIYCLTIKHPWNEEEEAKKSKKKT